MNDLTTRKDSMLRTYGDLMNIADMLVKSKMLPQSITTKEAAAAIILKGRELGIPTMEAFTQINVIQGKPTISPQCMIALARRTKELEDISITDENDTAIVLVKRKGQSPFKTSFSAKDAVDMGLANKDNWKKQPKVMRQWRAISANFRITFPDVIGGMYTPEELGGDIDDEGAFIPNDTDIVDVTPVATQTPTPNSNGHATTAPAPVPGTTPLPPPVRTPSTEQAQKYSRQHPPLSPVQRNKLSELFKTLNGTSDEETAAGLDNLFVESFKHGMGDATYEEGAKMTGQLLTALRAKVNQPA